jgi:hypothetical protein
VSVKEEFRQGIGLPSPSWVSSSSMGFGPHCWNITRFSLISLLGDSDMMMFISYLDDYTRYSRERNVDGLIIVST